MASAKFTSLLSDMAQFVNGALTIGQELLPDGKKIKQRIKNKIGDKKNASADEDMSAMKDLIAQQAEKIKNLEKKLSEKN